MSFATIETLPIARSLAQIADQEDDLAEVYLERVEEVVVADDRWAPGVIVRREEGFAVRLVREGATWLATRDGFDGDRFETALRQAARALPTASYTIPQLEVAPATEPVDAPEVVEFESRVRGAVSRHHVAFPMRIDARRHRREVRIVGTKLVSDSETEIFYSCRVALPWGGHGSILTTLDQAAADRLAASLVATFRGSKVSPIECGIQPVVLGPAATAVFLHEAVAHALETDTLALGGRPEAAIGVQLGSEELNVLDDPGGAPPGVSRKTDDEGTPVVRRWLLFAGQVRQPLADLLAACSSDRLTPGAGRRSNRHLPPAPRSTHLELLTGAHTMPELLALAEGGLYLPEASSGSLDPRSGEFRLRMPYGHRIRSGEIGGPVGPLILSGRVAELLEAVAGVGAESEVAGAGWCAKGGQRMPVWATTPALALNGVEVSR